jgi:hypothetical protein
VKTTVKDVQDMLVGLGLETADGYDEERTRTRLARLANYEGAAGTLTGPQKELFDDVVAAIGRGEPIDITGEWPAGDGAPEKKAPKKKEKKVTTTVKKAAKNGNGKAKKGAKSPAKAQANGKPVKNGKPAKDGGPGRGHGDHTRVGVVDSIVEFLQDAGPKKPLTKKDVLDKLAKRFGEDRRDSMWNTVSSQIPNRIKREKNITVHGDKQTGFYIKKGK